MLWAMERPQVFREMGYADALRTAATQGRWLIVDGTAAWCGPCQQMDRTTWRDEAVKAWVDAHAIAVQVDVDADSEIAQQLEISAMPTVIAIRAEHECDRIVGYRNAAGMLQWLTDLEAGATSLDRLRRSIDDPERDAKGRLALAQALVAARRYDEAVGEYLWLWEHMAKVDPGMTGVRVSFMATEIAELVHAHAPAFGRFRDLRDQTEERAGGDVKARFDWIVLNDVLGEGVRTLAWFDSAKEDPAETACLDRVAHRLIPLLRERGRWADMGRLHRDPLGTLARVHALFDAPTGLPDEMKEELRVFGGRLFRAEAALLVRSLTAAGRAVEATEVEREALRLDPSVEMQAALAGQG
jgi:thioredoxin 1